MRKTLALLLLGSALLTAACTRDPLFPGVSRWERQKAERFTSDPADTLSGGDGPVLYMSAVRFIKGYDWQLDTAAGRRHAEIVLFRNGTEILHLNADDISPDRHRIREGHLYTDRIDGNRTVLSRDGVELFRFEGQESIRGFLVRDGHVHTLGQRAGAGFSYRVDGKEIFRDDAGTLLGGADDGDDGAFSADEEGLWYSYSIPVRNSDGVVPEYRVMRENETVAIIPAGSFRQVFDIRRLDGALLRTELRTADNSSLCLVEGSVYHALGLNSSQTAHLCRILSVEGKATVFGYHTEKSGKFRYWLRTPEQTDYLGEGDQRVEGFRSEGAHRSWMTVESGRIFRILKDGEDLPVLPGQFRLTAPACTRLHEGTFYAVLTDMEDSNHRIYVDDNYTEVSFNGYFTGIQIE